MLKPLITYVNKQKQNFSFSSVAEMALSIFCFYEFWLQVKFQFLLNLTFLLMLIINLNVFNGNFWSFCCKCFHIFPAKSCSCGRAIFSSESFLKNWKLVNWKLEFQDKKIDGIVKRIFWSFLWISTSSWKLSGRSKVKLYILSVKISD